MATSPGVSEAILLVGGLGTRLRPLTESTPKPMLPVAGVPFIAHQLARLRDAGIGHIVLATSYRADVFEGYLGAGESLGVAIDYVTEDEPLGTGGAIRNAAERLTSGPADPVLVLNGDILSGHDLAGQVAQHEAAGAAVTMYLTRVADARPYGCVPTDADGRVIAFLEKMPEPVSDQINAGCYVFRRDVIDLIPPGEVVSVERATFPALVSSGALVLGDVDDAYWLDVGTPAAFVRGSCDLVLGRLHSSALPGATGESLLLRGADVAEGADVSGGTTIGGNARIGPATVVRGCVVMDGADVARGARLVDSVVGVGARIGSGTELEGAVVGDGAVVGAGCRLGPGARVWVDEVLPDSTVRTADDG